MKTNSEFKFPYFLAGIALGAVGALLLAPSPGEDTLKYLRDRSNKGLDYLNQRAGKLRRSAEGVVKKGREIVGSHRDSVDTATEAEKQAYQEEKQENLGDKYSTFRVRWRESGSLRAAAGVQAWISTIPASATVSSLAHRVIILLKTVQY